MFGIQGWIIILICLSLIIGLWILLESDMMLLQHRKLNHRLLQGFNPELVSLFLSENTQYFMLIMDRLCRGLHSSMLLVQRYNREVIYPKYLEIRDWNQRLQIVMMLVLCRAL